MLGRCILITCEHAGNELPESYKYLFKRGKEALESHRGWDPGAAILASYLGVELAVPVFMHPTSRLLVEVNRSLNHPQLFSEFTIDLEPSVKQFLLNKYYRPYRNAVTDWIKRETEAKNEVAHFSIHSFTPVWEGKKRPTDIGILFDPKRRLENKIALELTEKLRELAPLLTIDLNEPYKGTDDGFTTWLRKKFGVKNYSGIEIEVNQKFFFNKELDFVKSVLSPAIKSLEI
ncbi:N-formylglutamate amidohydrolase [Roseivirga seohaensis]|uniref:N-formylglutamate amidohydrolase n=1 Tax=Roseivirga seohaensis TaxID=1914963 RepID=UPI003BACE4B6